MSLDLLGEGFDLHGGGDDLVFPHHENERAQAEAAGHRSRGTGSTAAWCMVGGEKMSKSLGNFTTARPTRSTRYGPRAFRLAVLQAHYRRADRARRRRSSTPRPKGVERLDALVRRARRRGRRRRRSAPIDTDRRPLPRPRWTTTSTRRGAVAVIFEAVARRQPRHRRRRRDRGRGRWSRRCASSPACSGSSSTRR